MTTEKKPDPAYLSGRREALTVLAIWLVAMAYTVTYSYLHGYHREVADLTFVLGFPDWVFWGVVMPWLACLAISWLFAFVFMTDEDLGAELDDHDDGDALTGEARHAGH